MTTVPTLRVRAQGLIIASSRSRPAQAFLGLWLVCALLLLLYGHNPVQGVALLIGIGVFMLITALNTEAAPHSIETNPAERRKLYAQLAALIVLLVLTGFGGMQFHGLVARDAAIPLWTPFVGALERLSGATFGNDNYVANPVQYFVVPLIVLLLLGAKLPELGLGRGHRVGRVLVIWCTLPVLAIVYLLATGAMLSWTAQMLLSNALQNGFFEEFLFRGALQTRLRRLMSPAWALVVQAVAFGVWHVGLGYGNYGDPGGVIAALASTIVFQAVLGLAFGYIFERSRNLIAPSVFHVLYNTMFSL